MCDLGMHVDYCIHTPSSSWEWLYVPSKLPDVHVSAKETDALL
jgi:hypothetical protein